jgi:hypothetical protein
MNEFLNLNTGIRSRIGYTFNFKDYTPEELTDIFLLKLGKNGFNIEESATEKVRKLMKYFHCIENFGNGRFVDNIIQNTLLKHANTYSNDNINVITESDVPDIKEISQIMPEFDIALDNEKINEDALKRVAYHELGHAFVQHKLFPNKNINKITIEAEVNGTLGYVQHEANRMICSTRQIYINSISVCMAGLAAEKVFLGEYASGGGSDLKHSIDIAKRMIINSGMSKRGFFISDENSEETTNEINEIIQEAYEKAISIIENDCEKIQKAKELLMDKKTLDKEEIEELFS